MNYANGPGFHPHHTGINGTVQSRLNLTVVDTTSPTFKQDAAVPLGSETHGGEDVAIFAHGPMSHLFHGVHEQNYIAHVMMFASCVGGYRTRSHCPVATSRPAVAAVSTTTVAQSSGIVADNGNNGNNGNNVASGEETDTQSISIDHYHHRQRRAAAADTPSTHTGNAGIWDDTNWNALAGRELEKALGLVRKVNKAKNVIMFIGDGMGVSTLAAARLYHAESRGLKGEEIYLPWEKFPNVALSRTYNVDTSTPDSAGTGTAYLCGVKANMETIGVSDRVKFRDCSSVRSDTKVRSIVKESIAQGKWTGVVTTTRITHASPAAGYAHVSDRDWEAYMPSNSALANQRYCDDIAKQLIMDKENSQIRVILGGGRQMFFPNRYYPEYNNETGRREDNLDLIQTWKDFHPSGHFVMNKTEFDSVDASKADYLFGLFSSSHMEYEADRSASDQPSLTEMTQKAIQMLQRSENGYFLFVEGGRIDHSHHDGVAYKALNDTLALADAVKMADEMTDDDDTLIVVTADHSHVFTFGGYATFKTSIFDVTDAGKGSDGKPYLQLHYANGPGYYQHRNGSPSEERLDLTGLNSSSPTFKQDAAIPLGSETHGGEDVAIFAHGPMSHLFHGVHEQNYIARVMMYASCVGRAQGPHCLASSESSTSSINGVNSSHVISQSFIIWFSLLSATVVAFFLPRAP